jgi:hypothetical protein
MFMTVYLMIGNLYNKISRNAEQILLWWRKKIYEQMAGFKQSYTQIITTSFNIRIP